MVTVVAGPAGLDDFSFDLDWMQIGVRSGSASQFTINSYGLIYDFVGAGLTYTDAGLPTGGAITSWTISSQARVHAVITDFSIPATTAVGWIYSADFDLFAADDRFTGSDRNDDLWSLSGSDTIVAGAGSDTVDGGSGDDDLNGNTGNDIVYGGAGADRLRGGQGADFLNGNLGADTLFGDLGADTVRGGQGDDLIFGGDGADELYGDIGSDTLTGGAGADVFLVTLEQGTDLIADFARAEGDRIYVYADAQVKAEQVGADIRISVIYGTTGVPHINDIIVKNTDLGAMSGDWLTSGWWGY